jgi:tetratricopeptide (TPR) repeat protein
MNIAVSLPDDVKAYLVAAGEKFQSPLYALCAAESLTDEVATQLATVAGLEENEAIRFVRALHYADFVIERNSEWHFTSQMRSHLSAGLINQPKLFSAAHSLLFEISVTGDPKCAGESIPRYLLSGVGKAFHKSANSPADGLKLYTEAASMELVGTQWLLGRLAIEQQEQGILPSGAIEPPFLRGMTLYQERRFNEAEDFLRRVIKSEENREEVAISCHLVGKIDSRKPGMQAEAEELLRRSIGIGEKIHHEHHLAQALHTLGQLIGKDRNRVKEAEELLRRSLALLEKLHDQHGQAQALHTLGQLIGKDRNRVKEAEELLRRSLETSKHNMNHQAQVLFTLGKLIWDIAKPEAEQMLRRSLEINRISKNHKMQKMVQVELDRRLKEHSIESKLPPP